MPFDGVETTSLHKLAAVLRNPSQWPEGFRWDYRSAQCCGIGLHRTLFGELRVDTMSAELSKVFIGAHVDRRLRMHQVTPEMVANDLEDYLRKQSGLLEPIRRGWIRRLHNVFA